VLDLLNGYVRNVLARFAPGGDKFNVPRFMWQEIRVAMDDARKGLPYAPYLMFVIERVTDYPFVKDGLHEQYKIEKQDMPRPVRPLPLPLMCLNPLVVEGRKGRRIRWCN
jgi:hypothetical protein